MRELKFAVAGTPAPQGSKTVRRAGGNAGGRPIVVESSKKVRPWRQAAAAAARDAIRQAGPLDGDWEPLSGSLHVVIDFYFTRPRSHYGTGRNAAALKPSSPRYPAVQPDLSKLIRSTEDAITESGAWRDDALVVSVMASKCYDAAPGAVITIREMEG